MKPYQTFPTNSVDREHGVGNRILRPPGIVKFGLVFWLAILAGLPLAPKAWAQAFSTTNFWTGLGGDLFWPTLGNWSNNLAPTATSFVVLTNYGTTALPGTNGSGPVGTANIIVTNDTRAAALWIVNTNLTGAGAGFHTITISNGATLTISNSTSLLAGSQINVLQVTSQSGVAGSVFGSPDYGAFQPIYGTIQGAGGTLIVNSTNGLGSTYGRGSIFVSQGTLGGPLATDTVNATLDMSGLDNFRADVNRICVAADPGPAPYFYNRPNGTLYLAKTNIITLAAVGTHQSASQVNHGILAGMLAQNNGGPSPTRIGRIYLGQTNAIFCSTGIGLGIRTCSGWLGFNPSNAPGTSVAYFRDRAGTGRQSSWAIGNRLNASGVQNISGELDFSRGTVDALVGTLGLGVSATAQSTFGTLSFGSGTIDVNVLQVGVQSVAGGVSAQGTLSLSNTAILKINTSGSLGGMAGTPVLGSTYFGRLNITDGAQVLFANTAPLTCGVGSSSEIRLLNGSKLAILSVGTPAVPLSSLQISNSTLTIDRGLLSNPTVAPVVVSSLDAALTNTVNMLGTVLVAGRFPLIKYDNFVHGGFTNFVLGNTSPGVTGYLTNNPGDSTIDFVVSSSVTAVLTWDGRTNGVDASQWDIGGTTNWQGALAYQQATIPGSLVRFDDTAAGTTTVTLTSPTLAPTDLLVTNSAKNYTFTGSGGLAGPGALTKDGDGMLVLANSSSNGFTGGVLINKGTVQLSGSANRLPTNSIVTFADAGATLDLNNLDQTVGALSGGGPSGGNITMGSGNLTLRSGGAIYDGLISGFGALIKNTAGTQTFTAANTYGGGTAISNSTLIVLNSSGSGIGSGPVSIGAGGTLQIGNGFADGSVSAAYITNNGTLALSPTGASTLANVVVGAGNLVKLIGFGSTVYVTNANFHTGGSTLQQGIFQISHPNALGTGTIVVGNAIGTPTELDLANNITVTNAIILSGKTGALLPSPVGINNVNDVNSGQPGTNTLAGNITVQGSTCWAVGSDAGKLIIAGSFINAEAGTFRQFFLRGNGEGDWRSGIKNGSGGSPLYLDKTEGGSWTLSGTNTYTGRTLINAGTLVINGQLNGSSNIAVQSSAVLGGHGYISGPVTNSGSILLTLNPALESLTISNFLFLDTGSVTAFNVSSNGSDQLRGVSTVIYGGTLQVVLDGPLSNNCIFKLFDAQSYAGNFDAFDLPDIFPLTWDTSHLTENGTLHAVGAPIVTPVITSVSIGVGGGFTLSGTGSLVAPFNVLAATNITSPLGSWVSIGSGTFSNGYFVFTDLAATNYPQRFYLLVTPTP